MFRRFANALRIKIKIRPQGPLLIRTGGFALDPTVPDMAFVRVRRADGEETPYIPGSSLKGVVRGFVEKILRTWNHPGWRRACATFPEDPDSCAYQIVAREATDHRPLPSHEIYRMSCGACRLFGHTRLRGRVAFTDAYPDPGEPLVLETRYGVAISRRTQAVAHGPFEMEVAVAGSFTGEIILENFELWQVALLARALEAMNEGMLRIGYGKTRGLGEVCVEVMEAMLDTAGLLPDLQRWPGIAGLVDQQAINNYGLDPMKEIRIPISPDESRDMGFFTRRVYRGHKQWQEIAKSVGDQVLRWEPV